MKKTIALLAAAVVTFACCKPAPEAVDRISSPDGNLSAVFYLAEDGTPMYSLDRGEKNVILPSALGFELRGSLKASKLVFDGDKVGKVDE